MLPSLLQNRCDCSARVSEIEIAGVWPLTPAFLHRPVELSHQQYMLGSPRRSTKRVFWSYNGTKLYRNIRIAGIVRKQFWVQFAVAQVDKPQRYISASFRDCRAPLARRSVTPPVITFEVLIRCAMGPYLPIPVADTKKSVLEAKSNASNEYAHESQHKVRSEKPSRRCFKFIRPRKNSLRW